MNVKLLDCTLRDGGHVNNAEFGQEVMKSLVSKLSEADLDIVELGFLKNGSFSENQAIFNHIEDISRVLPHERNMKKNVYSVMIRPDWYDIRNLSPCNGEIGIIRFAFYYKDLEVTKEYCEYAQNFGYKVILNPVNIPGYQQEDLTKLVSEINEMKPYGMTIVDTFGVLTPEELERIYTLLEETVEPNIIIGLHLHENMSLAFSVAKHFLDIKKPERKAIIDASLLGMGRIPGNLCMEIIADYMNNKYDASYNMVPLLEAISTFIEPIKKEIPWGYSPAYYLTAVMRIHRSYAEYFLKKENLALSDIYKILKKIDRIEYTQTFNKEYAEKLYKKYMKI